MPIRLFVGNLPQGITEAELRDYFSAVGPVRYLSIPRDKETGQPRNFAFVEFSDQAQAEEAIHRFNNQLFKGRPLAVSEARARDQPRSRRPLTDPSPSRYHSPAPQETIQPPGSQPDRDFGPDAMPQRRSGKRKDARRTERPPKEPMRELVRGQFFSGADNYDEDDEEFNEIEDSYDSLVTDAEDPDLS